MSGEQEPPFSFDTDHQFTKGEKIYVIDKNGFDIYEAEITNVTKDGCYAIHYPEYPDEDCEHPGPDDFLLRNDANRKIFEEQEKVRASREQDEDNDEDGDFREDGDESTNSAEDDDFQAE